MQYPGSLNFFSDILADSCIKQHEMFVICDGDSVTVLKRQKLDF